MTTVVKSFGDNELDLLIVTFLLSGGIFLLQVQLI
jgi:hypothetical protein